MTFALGVLAAFWSESAADATRTTPHCLEHRDRRPTLRAGSSADHRAQLSEAPGESNFATRNAAGLFREPRRLDPDWDAAS